MPIEQLALRYNAETESIEFDNADGTTTSIPVSAFVKEYVGSIDDRIQISIDENNVIHATVLKNSIDWDCLSVELQERINDHVTSVDFATKAIRTDIAQNFSASEQQDVALSNIGLNFVHVDYSLLNTTLSDADFNRIWNAKGLIISGNDNIPQIFTRGRANSEQTAFYAISDSAVMNYAALLASSKKLNAISSWSYSSGSVRYDHTQTITDVQKQQARTNIGVQSADELLEDADFIAQLKTKLGIA